MTSSDPQSNSANSKIWPNLVGLARMLRGFRGRYAGAMVSLALSTSAKAGTFFLIRYLVDEVLQRPDLSQRLPWVALGFILLALTEGAFTFLSGRLASGTAEGIALRLRNQLFDHIQRLSFGYHDRTPTGDLITRVTSDVDAVRRFFAEQAIGIGRIALLFTVNGIALWQLNTQLALFSVMVVPLVLVMSVFFFKRVSKVYEQYQEQDSKLSTTLQENLTGVRVVKAFARQAYEQDKFEQDNWEKFQRGRRFLLMHSMFWPAADVLCNTQIISGFTFGAFLAMQGTISLGDYLAYMGLVVQLIWPMRELGRMIVQASTGIVSHGRIMEVLNEAQEPISAGDYAPAEQRVQGALAFRGVGFDYRGESRVLKDITFDAQPGQVVALLGPTGSGKTSLVNLLPRFYDYTAGSLTLDGVELTRYPRQFLRQQIGMVEQQAFLFSRTIRENIAYGVGRNVTDEQVEAAARAAAIHDVILSFPDGYNTLVGEKGITLSGGQKQRVAIARTLLKDPRILILDDSTSAVDTETEALIRGALETLMQGRTTFIIAHRLQSVMNADLIVVLEHGRIAQMGAHAELLQQDGLYRRIYDLQARIEVEVEKEVGPAAAPVDALESPTTHEARELELMAV